MASNRWLCLLALCAAAFGQTPDDKSAGLQGVVTNSVTGEPVLRAHVALRPIQNGPQQNGQAPPKRYGAITTADGKFSITGMDPGNYSMAIDKTGFTQAAAFPRIILQPGDKKEDLKLKLVPTGSISGRVVTPEGTPVENAAVKVVAGASGFGSNTRTDEKGQFRIGGLSAGKYRVRASPESLPLPPEIRTDGTKEVHYAATYYPGALLPRDATSAEVRAGTDTSGIDIRLVRTPIVRVSGSVTGLPAGAQNVSIDVRTGRSSTRGARVGADGTFSIWRLDPGKYTTTAAWFNAGARLQSAPVEVEVSDANIDHVTLNVFPPADFNGHVEYDDDQARPHQPQPSPRQPQRPPQAFRIQLNPVDGGTSQTVDLGADDSFHLTGLAPGRYRVSLTWGPAFVKTIRLGSTQNDGAVLDIRTGSSGNALTLVVSSAMASLTGTVSDDRGPAPSAMVGPLPMDWGAYPQIYLTNPKPDGTYSFDAIPPGRYKIAAVDDADRTLLARSGDQEGMMDLMETIEVHANDKLTKDLKTIKP